MIKINQFLFSCNQAEPEDHIVERLMDKESAFCKELKQSKKYIIINVKNVVKISMKIINCLVRLAHKKDFEIYILQDSHM